MIKITFSNSEHNWFFASPTKKIGIVSFTDPRKEVHFAKEREEYIQLCHTALVKQLEKNGYQVINPQLEEMGEKITTKNWGISTQEELDRLLPVFYSENISSMIIGCFAWNEPNIPLELAKKINVPISLVTIDNSKWPGITALTSTGATFWQLSNNYYIKNHERFLLKEGNYSKDLASWLKATVALQHLQNGKILLWGGSPSLSMEHLNDDISSLKRFLINDIITSDQYLIIRKAEEIFEKDMKRIDHFLNWLKKMNCKIIYDDKMLSKESLAKQIALYLSSKDLLQEYHRKHERVIGVSIKCQPEISVNYGFTPCLIPAFLPFPIDSEGEKIIIPTVCEGDIKGLLTSCLLFGIESTIPPLFGDLKILKEKYFVIANCGAASAYFAANSNDPKDSLAKSTIAAQCQGNAGGAFGYRTPETKELATYARLIRLDTNYILQYGVGKIINLGINQELSWGSTWPHTAVELKVPNELFVKAIGTNHLSLTLGNHETSLYYLSKLLDIPYVRLDDQQSIEIFLENI
ncbi:MAG: fucose isomerase [Candidatus Thorarchaeota archaeon]